MNFDNTLCISTVNAFNSTHNFEFANKRMPLSHTHQVVHFYIFIQILSKHFTKIDIICRERFNFGRIYMNVVPTWKTVIFLCVWVRVCTDLNSELFHLLRESGLWKYFQRWKDNGTSGRLIIYKRYYDDRLLFSHRPHDRFIILYLNYFSPWFIVKKYKWWQCVMGVKLIHDFRL